MAEQRYRVIERLEAGGMAEVFLGESVGAEGFKKRVAIKRVLPHLAQNKRFISMFLDEARLGAKLNHANIVTVFDIGAADNTYFLVMEFVDGANLKAMVENIRRAGQTFPPKEAIYIAMEACRGLSYAHELADDDGNALNIVHRDVSPPNIMVTKRGEVKMTDFGLAKATTQLEKTDPGVVKGKFSYLAPEAAYGRDVDQRADVFAMGIVLWEMLAGRRLFLGETDYQTVKLVQEARIPSLRASNPDFDEELEEVLGKALAREPSQRYSSARDFGDALAGYLFSKKLKVTSYDIANLVSHYIPARKPKPKDASIIDRLIQEELLRFTSIDDLADPLNPVASPSPDDAEGARPLDIGAFENPQDWFADEEIRGSAERISARAAKAASAHQDLRVPEPDTNPDLASTLEEDSRKIRISDFPSSAERRLPRLSGPAAEDQLGAPQPPPPPPEKKSNAGLWIAIVTVVLAGGAAAAYFGGLIPH